MDEQPWFILIYQTVDADGQARLAASLEALGGLVVQTDQNNGDYYVTIEGPGRSPALTMHELVMSIDADAILIDTHAGPKEDTDTPSPLPESAPG
jgi:hypothetical protein